jgi:glyoxylase I family protein
VQVFSEGYLSKLAIELQLHRILVFAPDLQVARQFYGETLGLKLEVTQGGVTRFRGSNFELDLFECEGSTESIAYSRQAGSAVAFSVSSLDVAMSELRSKGVDFLHERPNEAPDGTRYAAFADPFGTVFELIERRGSDRTLGSKYDPSAA